MCLGLYGIDLRDFGFGEENLVWHHSTDLNAIYAKQYAGSIPEPYFFCDAPAHWMDAPNVGAAGCQRMVMMSPCSYQLFQRLREQDEDADVTAKPEDAARIIRILERDFVPGLSAHIEAQGAVGAGWRFGSAAQLCWMAATAWHPRAPARCSGRAA